MDEIIKSPLEAIQDFAEYANSIASLVVGHRRILVEGGFDINLADSMAASLHAQLLGLVPTWELEDDLVEIITHFNDEDDE